VLIPLLSSVSHQFSHSQHLLAGNQPWLPASSQTNFTQAVIVVQTHARVRLQTKPHLTRILNADFFFYESLFVVKQETIFIGRVH